MWTDCQSDTIQKRPSNMEIKNYSQGKKKSFNFTMNLYYVYPFLYFETPCFSSAVIVSIKLI